MQPYRNNKKHMAEYNKELGNPMFVPTTGGRNNPKQIHVAHRKSQSELTDLMVEQFTLQKQLEIVQAQQQHLLQQQQNVSQQSGQYYNGNNLTSSTYSGYYNSPKYPSGTSQKSRTHSRNNSGYYNNYSTNTNYNANSNYNNNNQYFQEPNNSHRRSSSQSSVYGHSRRHSLVLNEAKKAAAEEQAKRVSGVAVNIEDLSLEETSFEKPSGFKFPSNLSLSPSESPSQSQTSPSHQPNTSDSNSTTNISCFQFPQTQSSAGDDEGNTGNDFILTSSTHRRTKSRSNDPNSSSSSNWRSHLQSNPSQQSPFRHRQSNSREFNSISSLEAPAYFQKGHKPRASNGSIQIYNNNNPNQRKSLFAPYLPQANIPQLIEEGKLVVGILRVNKKNRSDAWVSTDGVLDSDIYICGSKDRNRALEGDLVAVELLVVDDVWDSKREKEQKKRRKDVTNQDIASLDTNDDYHNDASAAVTTANALKTLPDANDDKILGHPKQTSIKRKNSLKKRPTQKKNDDVEVEGQSLLLAEEEEINDDFKPLYAGHVVAVLDRIPGQLFSGTLGLLRPSQQASAEQQEKPAHAPKIVWFKPTDKKVPLLAIPTEFAPNDFVDNAGKYADKLYVASIKRWPITSLHPFGLLVSELGEINDPEVEIDSILRDNNFLSNEYLDPKDQTVENFSFQTIPISDEMLGSRKQFAIGTQFDVLALSANKDIADFAIHIKDNNDGTIDLGCHTIDITSHIEEGSSLDRRARKRSLGVFMPQKIVNLLPNELNKSLKLEKDRMSATISVVYTLNSQDYSIKSTWIGESVVSPSLSMSIEEIDKELSLSKGTSYLSKIEEIARSFYSKRIGLLNSKLIPSFSLFENLDDEKVDVDLNILDRTLGSAIINELHKKVNATVAEKLYAKLGSLAFLRRQVQPVSTKLDSFKIKVQKMGNKIDTGSAESLLQSILRIEDLEVRTAVELMAYKYMTRGRYFVAGKTEPDQYGSYINNIPLYTHFTSPMKRYADHVVHRQLKSILNETAYDDDLETLKITSDYCNFKKDCAFQAQEQAIHLLLCKTINSMGDATGQLLTMAKVVQVYESSFDVIIPEFGIEKRVHGDQLPLIKAEFDATNRVLELYWQPGTDSATFVPVDEKNPKSYRNSIKNKFNSTSKEIATLEAQKHINGEPQVNNQMRSELERLHLKIPNLVLPKDISLSDPLKKFTSSAVIRKENGNCIQEIRELQSIPILLRAEIGMALPCLTVRALNPFMEEK